MVAAGVPAAGLRGGWRDCCIVNAPERSGLGRAMCYWRWFRGRRSSSRSGGASELGRAEAASVTGVSLARWLRRGRWNCEGVSTREPQAPPSPVAKHRGMAGPAAVLRLGAVGGVVVWLSTPPRAEWLTLPRTERARRAESSTWLAGTRLQAAALCVRWGHHE